MKTLDDLVIGRNGLWFTLEEASKAFQHSDSLFMYDSGGSTIEPIEVGVRLLGAVISKTQFQQRAKELGFVGRYRWGVEYKTDGKRPELVDGVVVAVQLNSQLGFTREFSMYMRKDWSNVVLFKITDQRYKPADTSYLENNNLAQFGDTDVVESDWYDYDNQKALRLPPVGEKVEAFMHWAGGWSVGWVLVVGHDADGVIWRNGSDTKSYIHSPRCEIRPLNHDRKAKAERKRTLDAIYNKWNERGDIAEVAEWIYESGFRLPD